MPNLQFKVESAKAVPFAIAPMLMLELRVENAPPDESIHTVALRAQIQIEVMRRSYTHEERERLHDLFGEPERWSRTLRTMLWTHASTVIPSFKGHIVTGLQVPCSFDFNVAATKYFYGLSGGDVPLELLFSGTVFYADGGGALQVAPISWNAQARFRLPVNTWREMMDAYYPNSAWLCLHRDTFDRLYRYKMRRGMTTWEEALDSVLPATEEELVP
ncbi:MAG TPA: DUF6084 family protein [Bryobacteraceae bacterium]|nr:DUF6084 family protein [Bryobacteraceae bacterium]